jgi:hypothetical protein
VGELAKWRKKGMRQQGKEATRQGGNKARRQQGKEATRQGGNKVRREKTDTLNV